MVGYSADVSELEGKGGSGGTTSRVQAVVDLYGPTDLTAEEAKGRSEVSRFLGGKTIEEAPELYKLASPVNHVSRDDPPTLIIHGSIDSTVPIHQAERLAERLKEAGVEYELDRVEGWPHTMDLEAGVNRHCIAKMFEFFDKHLGGPAGDSAAKN
jgi:dipeptidyl aminopeptidase/acylaminoacyl peptidase